MNRTPRSPVSAMLTEEYQARLAALSRALCGEPVRTLWLSGSVREGWYLSGQRDGDFALPDTKGCITWQEALDAAEKWVRKPTPRVGTTTDEILALARRALKSKNWRWLPGMLRLRDASPDKADFLKKEGRVPEGEDDWSYEDWPVLPDLSDPATLGCLLHLVQQIYYEPYALWEGYVEIRRDHRNIFFVLSFLHDSAGYLKEIPISTGKTATEALVAALEAK